MATKTVTLPLFHGTSVLILPETCLHNWLLYGATLEENHWPKKIYTVFFLAGITRVQGKDKASASRTVGRL